MEKLTKKSAILLASQRFSFIASVKLPNDLMEKAYTLELDLHEICLNNCDISVFLYYNPIFDT